MNKKNKSFKSKNNIKENIKKSVTLSMDEEYIKRKDKVSSFFFSPKYVPMTLKQLLDVLGVPKEDKHIFKSIIENLKDDGIIMKDSSSKYILIDEKNTIVCTYESKSGEFSIAKSINDKSTEFLIPNNDLNVAFDGDTVLIASDNSSKYRKINKRVGRIVKVVKRAKENLCGRVYRAGKYYFVMPILGKYPSLRIDQKIDEDEIHNGDFVDVKITKYPSKNFVFEGKIVRKISEGDSCESFAKALEISYDIDKKEIFPSEVIKEVEKIPKEVIKDELLKRENKTEDNVYTIDSEDSKDLDDAICVKKLEDGKYLLSVHIADVSHYVKEKTKLDEEAIKRGTSIYIPEKVIPMLPKELSNGICSLNENEIRLTLSVDMYISKNGDVTDYKIYKSYIKSKKKMTYEKVYKCITKSDDKVLKEYKNYLEDIDNMLNLSKILRKRRFDAGSINFDIPEPKVVLDKKGNVIDVKEYSKNEANNIIEEFMLLTNETVAKHFYNYGAPFIYRVHEKPDEEKIRDLNYVLAMYNKRIKSVKGVTPKVLSDILNSFENEEEKQVISASVLRTLKLAKYDSMCLGHFGLAFKYYTHFTSPIRRYPDLFIHRVISDYIENNYYLNEKKYEKYIGQAISYSLSSSELEKNATKIEREFDNLYTALYMKDKLGKCFDAVVSSVTSFGMYVKIKGVIEGLVHISTLKGYYVFDEKRCILECKNKSYKIGDKVKVKLARVDVRLKQIDFEIEK